MGYLRLYTYGGKTAAELKAKASIPSQADITVGSNYIDCSSVDIPSEIRDVIGEGSNDLGTIYLSAKVNKWSGFGSREWYVSGGVLYDRPRSNPYDMSNFCGYNHYAVAPSGISLEAATIYCYRGIDQQAIIGISFQIGEIDWSAINGIIKMGLISKIDGLTKCTSYMAITYGQVSLSNLFLMNLEANATIISDLVFLNSADVVVAKIPNILSINTSCVMRVYADNVSLYFPATADTPAEYMSTRIAIPQENAPFTVDMSGASWAEYAVYAADGGTDITNTPALWGNNCYLRIFPININYGAIKAGLITINGTNIVGIEVAVSQQAGPAIVNVIAGNGNVLAISAATGSVVGSLNIQFTPHYVPGGDPSYNVCWFIKVNGVDAYSSESTGIACSNDIHKGSTTIASGSATWQDGDVIDIYLYYELAPGLA